jgi:hypothetical protein
MTNLDLHNRLLQIAKDVRRLKDAHPELDLYHLEADLNRRVETSVGPSHPVGPSLYRKGD